MFISISVAVSEVLLLCMFVNIASEDVSLCVQYIRDAAEFQPLHLGNGSQDVAMEALSGTLLSINDSFGNTLLSIDDGFGNTLLSVNDKVCGTLRSIDDGFGDTLLSSNDGI